MGAFSAILPRQPTVLNSVLFASETNQNRMEPSIPAVAKEPAVV
jgi:hypothetical protein